MSTVDRGDTLRRLLDVRIVRWPYKLLYVVGVYGVLWGLFRVLDLLGLELPQLSRMILLLVLETSAVLYGARIFRGRNEEVAAPREYWRMTARRPMSKRLGITFTVLAGLASIYLSLGVIQRAGVDVGRLHYPGDEVLTSAGAAAEYSVLAFLYLRSARHLPKPITFMGDPPQLVDRLYGLYNARLAGEAVRYLHPEVEWSNTREGGYLTGRDAVRDYWEREWKETDPKISPVSVHVEEDGDLTVRVHKVVHDRAGALLSDDELDHLYGIRDGLVAHMEVRSQRASAMPPVT